MSENPYETDHEVRQTCSGLFPNLECTVRVRMERQSSIHETEQYEARYVNLEGYWVSFHKSGGCARKAK